MAIIIGPPWTKFCVQKLKGRILPTYDFNRRYVPHSRSYTRYTVLRTVFEDRIISLRADVVWPPRSCDLISLDYYLWGAVKDKCYADKPETIDNLKDKLHIIDNVLKNWTDRVDYCMASRGSHLNEIIFHYKSEGLYFQIKQEIWENIQYSNSWIHIIKAAFGKYYVLGK